MTSRAEAATSRKNPISQLSPGFLITTAGTTTTSYDVLGRVTSQTDGPGNTANTNYDAAGRVATSNDGKASATYTDNGTDAAGKAEYRGLVTATTVSGLTGTSSGFTAAYDPDAALTLEQHPNGMRAATTFDPAGRETALVWTASAGRLLAASARQCGVDGNVAVDTSLGRVSRYSYGPADRLTRASGELSGAGTCTTRAYTFDADSNRTGLDTWTGTLGACPDTSTTPTTTAPRSYDPAGRATHPGYTYDGLGRTRTLPAVESPTGGEVTLAYYGNDLVASMTSGSTVREYGLDALGRLASWTDTVDGVIGARVVNHYPDPGTDAPDWTLDTNTSGTATTRRYLDGLTGGLTIEAATTGGSTTLTAQLVGLHGDILRTTSLTATGSPDGHPGIDTDEYGVVRDTSGAPTTGPRHAWLGTHQRPADTGNTGLILMGVRLYTPLLGRFLQADPIYGGNPNTYTYPPDPINAYDLDGKAFFVPLLVIGARVALHYGMRRAAMWSAQRAVQVAANQARRQFLRQGWRHVLSERQQQYSFARGRELHLRTAKNLERRGVSYGKARGPKGTPRRFSPDFRFGKGCDGGHGCLGVELKTWRGGSHSVGGWLR
jgi:RHS repeat-associated protein